MVVLVINDNALCGLNYVYESRFVSELEIKKLSKVIMLMDYLK